MPPPIKGYFYRRVKNRHYPKDDPDHQDAPLYFCWQAGQKRRAICTHTADLATAEERIEVFGNTIPITDYDRFLKELILIGRRAQQKLDDRIDQKANSIKSRRQTRP
jgi:hypothetical protein